jgi:hypothetical protein
MQPLGVCFFGSMKRYLRIRISDRVWNSVTHERLCTKLNRADIVKCVCQAYNDAYTPQLITSCFSIPGLWPRSPHAHDRALDQIDKKRKTLQIVPCPPSSLPTDHPSPASPLAPPPSASPFAQPPPPAAAAPPSPLPLPAVDAAPSSPSPPTSASPSAQPPPAAAAAPPSPIPASSASDAEKSAWALNTLKDAGLEPSSFLRLLQTIAPAFSPSTPALTKSEQIQKLLAVAPHPAEEAERSQLTWIDGGRILTSPQIMAEVKKQEEEKKRKEMEKESRKQEREEKKKEKAKEAVLKAQRKKEREEQKKEKEAEAATRGRKRRAPANVGVNTRNKKRSKVEPPPSASPAQRPPSATAVASASPSSQAPAAAAAVQPSPSPPPPVPASESSHSQPPLTESSVPPVISLVVPPAATPAAANSVRVCGPNNHKWRIAKKLFQKDNMMIE